MHFRFLCSVAVIASVLLTSCAGSLPKICYLEAGAMSGLSEVSYTSRDREVFLERVNELRRKIKGHRGRLKLKDYDDLVDEFNALVQEYKKHLNAESVISKDKDAIIVPPKTKLTVHLATYCLSPYSAAPVDDEPYIMVGEKPAIPLYEEIMRYTYAKERVDRVFKQNLIWDLKNEVKFEDLSEREKALLLKIDPAAYLKVNNQLKQYLKSSLLGLVNEYVPGSVTNAIDTIKGKAYEYRDYARQIERIRSKIEKPSNVNPIKARGHEVYTIIKVHGFSDATVTFINITDSPQRTNSYFVPLRKDVQPLGCDLPDMNEYANGARQAFGELLSDVNELLGRELQAGDRLTIERNPDKLVQLLKAARDRELAYERTEKEFKDNFEDDISDAFRHAFWNALMVRDIGYEFAREVSDNHELNPGSKEARDMDFWNNKIGRDIGQKMKDQGVENEDLLLAEIMKNKHMLRRLK